MCGHFTRTASGRSWRGWIPASAGVAAGHEVGYPRAVALAHVAELLDELLPDREANDAVFRLTLSVLSRLRGPEIWMPVTYFELWMTRLVGFLPELSECVVCGETLNGSRAYFTRWPTG